MGVPADILLSRGIVRLHGTTIPCIQVKSDNKCRRVTAADNYVVPPYSEKIIQAFVERNDDGTEPTEFIVEPNEKFSEKYELLMACSLIDIEKSTTVPVRLLNPTCTQKQIWQYVVLGNAEEFLYETVLEDPGGSADNITIGHTVRHTTETEKGQLNEKLPEHLRQLYEDSLKSNELDEKSQRDLFKLLFDFQDTFSKNDLDLGLTHINEHAIDTGNARPIELPPRRVPIAYAEAELKTITDMEKEGIIRKSNSPWASPLNLV
ncbi:uncharacterized protein LOC133182850 [Saccostrea echinata]|uniref:uncharacterized protein LOC133182850 n=1 Tax=Saccostrea echinata TaxID=191078 RepID=UPI002A7F4548|nr:uncharacterized protein LOC133182850 [Saccostrea echinata]